MESIEEACRRIRMMIIVAADTGCPSLLTLLLLRSNCDVVRRHMAGPAHICHILHHGMGQQLSPFHKRSRLLPRQTMLITKNPEPYTRGDLQLQAT